MKKNFSDWHVIKTELQNTRKNIPLYFRERQIWYVSCGLNIGVEQDGKGEFFKRPVLILKRFNQYSFWGIPLSTAQKSDDHVHFSFIFTSNRVSCAKLSQLRLYDSKRLMQKIGLINSADFKVIKEKIKRLLA